MPTVIFELDVEMEPALSGGESVRWRVVADQRDMARWEVQPFGGPLKDLEAVGMTAMRFLAWSASVRQRLFTGTFEQWSNLCIEAMPIDDEPEAGASDDGPGDPGLPAR